MQPLYGGNVGASARAMANMALEDLRLVQPQYRSSRELELFAKGAASILEGATICEELSEAVGDCTTVIACSARPRRWKSWKVLDPGEAARLLVERGAAGEPTALLFGREDQGLDRADLTWATHLCHIPTGPQHSSLNLSQAVLLLGWEWAQARGGIKRRSSRTRKREVPGMEQIVGAADQIGQLLDRIGFFAGRNRAQSLSTVQQAMIRGELTDTEVHFLRGVVNKLRWYVDHGPRLDDGGDVPQAQDDSGDRTE